MRDRTSTDARAVRRFVNAFEVLSMAHVYANVFGKTFVDTLACRISTLRHEPPPPPPKNGGQIPFLSGIMEKLHLGSIDFGDLLLLLLLFQLFREDGDEELLIAIGLLLIL